MSGTLIARLAWISAEASEPAVGTDCPIVIEIGPGLKSVGRNGTAGFPRVPKGGGVPLLGADWVGSALVSIDGASGRKQACVSGDHDGRSVARARRVVAG